MTSGLAAAHSAPSTRESKADWRDTNVSRKWILFTILASLNVMDLVLTETGLSLGVLAENNPFMKSIVEHWWLAALVKFGALATVGGLFYLVRERSLLVERALLVCIAWYSWVVAWNYSLIITAL
ncbi:MAG: DUF5658 family protein [Acidimicrobiales bacterium]